jgi:hypothetical protein
MLHIKPRLIPFIKMFSAISLMFSVQLLTGCASKQQNETIAGVVVPIPAEMKKISHDKVNFGPWKGEQASFRGEISREEIVKFYHDVLPADNWQPDARLGAEIGGYAFTRGVQTFSIRVTEEGPNTSTLTVLVKAGEADPAGA